MTIVAYKYETKKSKVLHLRARLEIFSEAAKARLERVGSPARWIAEAASWDWPLTAAAVIALQEAAVELGEQVDWRDGLQELAAAHLRQDELEHQTRLAMERIIRDPSVGLDPFPCIEVNPYTGEACPPMRHQKLGVHWSMRVAGLYLAWSPGVGKTRAAVDAAGMWYRLGQIPLMQATFLDGKPGVTGGVLVVCPRSMMKTWQREAALWQNMGTVVVAGDTAKKRRLAGSANHMQIVNYEGLNYVEHNHYAALILDECHKVANNSNMFDRAFALAQRTVKRLGLSGTMITNSLESVFNQMLVIDLGKSLGPSRVRFLSKFFHQEFAPGGYQKNIPRADAVEAVSAAVAKSAYFVKKEEVLPDLPAKTHTPFYLEMTTEQRKYYDEIKNQAVTYIQDATVTTEMAATRIMKLLQICNGFCLTDDQGDGAEVARHFSDIKTQTLMEMLTTELSGRKIIVWNLFRYEGQRIGELLTEAGISHIRMDGSITSQRRRDDMVDRWNTDPGLKVMVRQISLSEGVTLTAKDCSIKCSDCVYSSLSWRLTDWAQSQDRVHRYGQTEKVSLRYLLCDGGYDSKVFDSVKNKDNVAQAVAEQGKEYYLQLLRAKDN